MTIAYILLHTLELLSTAIYPLPLKYRLHITNRLTIQKNITMKAVNQRSFFEITVFLFSSYLAVLIIITLLVGK